MEVNTKTKKYKILHKMYEYVFNYSEENIVVKVSNETHILKPEESIIFLLWLHIIFIRKKQKKIQKS